MIENKENGDTETWSDIKKEFENAFNYWIYEFDKKNLSVDFILTVQDLFSNCLTYYSVIKAREIMLHSCKV